MRVEQQELIRAEEACVKAKKAFNKEILKQESATDGINGDKAT